MTIGQRIAQLRKQQNLSQEALGEALGVSRQAISKWESDAALPEIDKLIALSKRFGVTVGALLGVEEETARQGGETPEHTGPTEAEVLETYLNSLPRHRPVGRKWRVIGVIAAVILVFCAVNYIDALESRINNLNNTISNLSNQVVNMQYDLSGISDDISTRIDEALKQEYGLLANWSMELRELDYAGGSAVIQLNAVLKNKVEEDAPLSFYAQLGDGSYVTQTEGAWDGATNSYTARLTLPMTEDGITYYLSTPDGTVCLASGYGHELCNLSDGTQLQVWCSMSCFSDQADIEGWANLSIHLPWMLTKSNSDLGEVGEPAVEIWLIYNGERMTGLVPENPQVFDGCEWCYDCNISVDSGKIKPTSAPGDQIWVEYEVDFGNGLSASGTGDETWTFTREGTWDMYGEASADLY